MTNPTAYTDHPAPGHRRGSRALPLAAAVACALVVAFEAGVWKSRHFLWDANYILLETKRAAMAAPAPADDVAVLGSSRFYHVRPDAISAALGGARVTNYAWGYCGVEAYEAILRGLIQAGRTPKTVLVDGVPEIFAYKRELLSATKSEGLRTGLAVTAPASAAITTALAAHEYATGWQFLARKLTPPSTLNRQALATATKNFLKTGKKPALPPGYDRLVETWQRQGWFYFTDSAQIGSPADFNANAHVTGPWELRKSPGATAAYERFIALAARHNVQVILAPVPNNELAFNAFDRLGVYHRYDAWLTDLERRYPNFRAPAPRWYCWPGLLGDALHVNAAGAEKHMAQITQMLQP